jgi:O-antigen ligase
MFEAKPLTGWGYESFDRYDRDFQQRVGDLVYPVKDHASHNLFLTTLAEQGLVGFVLLFGPMFVWLVRTKRRWRALPMSGFLDRRLAAALSLVLASFVIVNCFFRMQISFGFGLWWLTLGLLASLVARTDRSRHADPAGPPVHISAGAR